METLCSACGKIKNKGHICDGMADTPETNKNLFRYGNKLDGDFKEEGIEPLFARKQEREISQLREALILIATGQTDCEWMGTPLCSAVAKEALKQQP